MKPEVFQAIREDGRLWTTQEVAAVLWGLMAIAARKPWFIRWAWKGWYNALLTALEIFASEAIIKHQAEREALRTFEDVDI